MQKLIYLCDKCGAEIKENERFLITTGPIGDPNNAESVDLCGTCYIGALKVLKIYLTGGKTAPTAEKPEKPAEPKKPKAKPGGRMRKKKLDLGKIAALRNAGWSLEKIADELGCCTQTTANHIKEAQDFLKQHQNDHYKQEEQQDE